MISSASDDNRKVGDLCSMSRVARSSTANFYAISGRHFSSAGFPVQKALRANRCANAECFEVPAIDAKANSAAIHFHIQRDRRDSTFYPTKALSLTSSAISLIKRGAVSAQYQTYKVAYKRLSHREREKVVAYRAMICSANQDVPFMTFGFYVLTMTFAATHRAVSDRACSLTQAEYRIEWRKRLGFVPLPALVRWPIDGTSSAWINSFRRRGRPQMYSR
jgi:hypothetical protein